MAVPLWRWSAADLAQTVREKQHTSQEVVAAHLERIDQVNRKVNAVTVVLKEAALRAAREADELIAKGNNVGPLHGVPVTIKENIDVVGSATTHGIVELEHSVADTDAPIVAHLKRAGAIPIARTNLPDFGARWHTDNDLRGATLNPWDPSRTPGGSSGGEAVAIATGMSPLGVGNDIGGSLRYPAQCCGIAALKPTLGRISRTLTSIFPEPPLFYHQIAAVNGPMARHVEDLRLALDVMSQSDPDDPWWTPTSRLGDAMSNPIAVALCTDPVGHGCSYAVKQGIAKAADLLAEAGYEVEVTEPPAVDEALQTLQQIADTEMQSFLPETLPLVSDDAKIVLEAIVQDNEPSLSSYMKAIGQRHRIAQRWAQFMQRYPLILTPISTQPPFEVGYDIAGADQLKDFIQSLGLTEICNLLGLPSAVVPVQVVDGLPQSVQLIGPRYHEDLCLDAAQTLQSRQGVFTPIDPRDGWPSTD